MLDLLKAQVRSLGKPVWRRMLSYLASLHEARIHPPFSQLPYMWEEVASYRDSTIVLGHWDTVHLALDTLQAEPQHGMRQILNILALQDEQGFIPGRIWVQDNMLRWGRHGSCPPLWPVVIHDYISQSEDLSELPLCYRCLRKQIAWFEAERRTEEGAFYYVDVLDRLWESGVEESARFDFNADIPDSLACVDATSHVYLLYHYADLWAGLLETDGGQWRERKSQLGQYIKEELYDEETGYFYDRWMIEQAEMRVKTFDGMWPMVVGAAGYNQVWRCLDENLLDGAQFNTAHPLSSAAVNEHDFASGSWRGPVRNSMTYWAARGCLNYGRIDAARLLVEKALDATAFQFDSTGHLWEYYHPYARDVGKLGGPGPYVDHIGHNPLIAMASLWESL